MCFHTKQSNKAQEIENRFNAKFDFTTIPNLNKQHSLFWIE